MTTPAPSFSLPLTVTDADGDSLTIAPAPKIGIAYHAEGALVSRKDDARPGYFSGESIGVFVSKEEAPAVALAILVSAGINPDSHGSTLESAAAALASIFAKQDRAAKLDAEAVELANAAYGALDLDLVESLDDVASPHARESWRAVAKAARKIAAKAAE